MVTFVEVSQSDAGTGGCCQFRLDRVTYREAALRIGAFGVGGGRTVLDLFVFTRVFNNTMFDIGWRKLVYRFTF